MLSSSARRSTRVDGGIETSAAREVRYSISSEGFMMNIDSAVDVEGFK